MKNLLVIVVGVFFLLGSSVVLAQPASTMYTLEDIYDYLLTGVEAAEGGHALEPPEGATPGDARFKTLKQIYEGVEAQFSQAAATAANVEEGVTFWSTDPSAWGVQTGEMAAGGGGTLVTGQVTSYRTGDDGDLQMGTAFDLEVGSDNTVIDNATGLQWTSNEPGTKNWNDAIDWANGLTQDGKSDWRLPNITELQTLFVRDAGQGAPFIDQAKFPDAASVSYWSSTSLPSHTDYALRANFNEIGRAHV